ncbi:MAG: efflux RND transporter periplasmic adaptor subunit [Myxococcota bacterium]
MGAGWGCQGAVEAPVQAQDTRQGKGGAPPGALVKTAQIKTGELVDDWVYRGEVRPLDEVQLSAAEAGLLTEVAVREGDRVEAGQVLVRLDTSVIRPQLQSIQAEVAEVGAELEQARRDLNRLERLSTSLSTQSEIEQARSRVKMLEHRKRGLAASAREVQARIGRHRIEAPFTSVVRQRLANPGGWVGVGQPVLDLVSADEVDVRVDAPPALMARVGSDTTAQTTVDGKQMLLKVAGVVPALDTTTRTARLRLVPAGPTGGRLVAGQVVDVVFDVAPIRTGGLLVPRDAIVQQPRGAQVVKVVEGKAQMVPVVVVATANTEVMIRGDGLHHGDRVVTRGNERLRPGTPVRFEEE